MGNKIVILGSKNPTRTAQVAGREWTQYEEWMLMSSLSSAGFKKSEYEIMRIGDETLNQLRRIQPCLILGLGEEPLRWLTGKIGIDKWNASPLPCVLSDLSETKVLCTYDFQRLYRQHEYRMFFFQVFMRAKEAFYEGKWKNKEQNFTLVTDADQLGVARSLVDGKDLLSVDIETSNGTINTLGFAWSGSDAVAIRCEPGYYSVDTQYALWSWAKGILENPEIRKIYQNNVYEHTYFARYGIEAKGFWWDTMWAQKLMYPEFKQGLQIVGQLFTREQYWKEDGKDWNNIDNWTEHLKYNCKDTSNTYEAHEKQWEALCERKSYDLYRDYLARLADPINEMCCNGLEIRKNILQVEEEKVTEQIRNLAKDLPPDLNWRSPKQKIEYLKKKGYTVPRKRKKDGTMGESVDELRLKQILADNPNDELISNLIMLSKHQKFLGSYVNCQYHDDGIIRYTLKGTGTETLRFSGGTDSWGLGFNVQTIPKRAKKFFKPPEGHVFLQVDLKQAESRYVAYDSNDLNLIEMLEDPDQDVHSFVAANAFGVPVAQVIAEKERGDVRKRQLGKKSGHGANYAMSAHTFQEQCFKEDLILSLNEAKQILETYHRLFPNLKRWHERIREEVRQQGWLENPMGFRRHFWGRMDDKTFREAYAFKPQSTIPMLMNKAMLYTCDKRTEGLLDFNLHYQCHDSVLYSVKPQHVETLASLLFDTDSWHPDIEFHAGRMVIPTEVEVGPTLDQLEEIHL